MANIFTCADGSKKPYSIFYGIALKIIRDIISSPITKKTTGFIMHKTNIFLIALGILLFASSILALNFSYDNYSQIPLLKYSFSFTGKNWFKTDEANELASKGFKTVEFGNAIPLFWEIESPAGKTLNCWKLGDYEKKPTKAILTLKDSEYAKEDNLLLDIIDGNAHNFRAVIIDLDGEKQYSNFIECDIS